MLQMMILLEVRGLLNSEITKYLTIIEHERIILQSKTKDHLLPRLTEPLKEGGRIKLAGGNIEVNQILGKRPRDILETRKGILAHRDRHLISRLTSLQAISGD
jgi:hypothetical protein